MRLDSGRVKLYSLSLMHMTEGNPSKDSKDAKGQEGTYHPWKTVLDTSPYPKNLA